MPQSPSERTAPDNGDTDSSNSRLDTPRSGSQGSSSQGVNEKQAQLSRMKWIATSLLVVVLAILVVSSVLAPSYPSLSWVRAFAEAATVGAVADWFAVVALFRHPLGLPIPHTAIIPRNKDRIATALGKFVEQNFLTPENIVRKLEQRHISRELGLWLSRPQNSTALTARICSFIPGLLSALEDDDMRRLLDRSLTPQLERLDLSAVTGKLLGLLTAQGRHQGLLDGALIMVDRWVSKNQEMLLGKFSEMSRYTPAFVDRYIISRFVAGLTDLLQQVAANPGHELRAQFDVATQEFIEKLKSSPEYHAQAEVLKNDLLAHLKEHAYYGDLWRAGRKAILADLEGDDSVIRRQLCEVLVALGTGLGKDHALQAKLDSWLIRTIRTFAMRHRHQISTLIEEIIRGWDAKEVAEKAELEIGKDLQYIRINGMVVGGMVGVVLHAFGKLL